MILAGDIGGTKTALGVYSHEKGVEKPLARETFASANYACLEDIVAEFRLKFDFKIEKAAFGVAGPVSSGKAVITNLPWSVDEEHLKNALSMRSVKLLNDLEAISWSVPSLEKDDIYALNDNSQPVRGGTIAVIAPGTGLGEAFLVWDGTRYLAQASEGGHTDLAPRNELEIELLRYLLKKYEHVSYERVCSGIGIPNIYNFFKDSGKREEPEWLRKELVNVQDPSPLIVNTALEKGSSCPICEATLEMFISLLGAEAGNMALKILPTGGVYLGGGIPPRILPQLQKGLLMKNFLHKGRMTKLLAKMPVNVILKTDMALTGTAYYGLEIL